MDCSEPTRWDHQPRAARYNDRKYYSLERAKEVLGYRPQDNSAEWDGEEKVR